MPSLRRSLSSPQVVRSAPYAASTAAASRHKRGLSLSVSRRVLADIDWWAVLDGQLPDEGRVQEEHGVTLALLDLQSPPSNILPLEDPDVLADFGALSLDDQGPPTRHSRSSSIDSIQGGRYTGLGLGWPADHHTPQAPPATTRSYSYTYGDFPSPITPIDDRFGDHVFF